MPELSVGDSLIHGKGVFVKDKIRRDEIILQIDDSRVVDEQNPLNPGEHEHYCNYLAGGKVVLLKSPERYINHSCSPNAYIKWIEGKRYLLARRNLRSGEEICIDYCIDSTSETEWVCNCGGAECRKQIDSDFFRLPLGKQIEYFDYLSEWFVNEHPEEYEYLKRTIKRLKNSNKIS